VDDHSAPDPALNERARRFYDRAVFGGDAAAIAVATRELDSVEAVLALARGRILHAQFLQDRIPTTWS
jgi:hypothetical protein